MKARAWAFGAWALVAASAVAWGLRAFATPQPLPAGTQVAVVAPPRGDLSRLFGADPPPESVEVETEPAPEMASRFQLLGVAAPRGGGRAEGVALVAVDGKPARAFRVGAVVDGELVLQSVDRRGAAFGPRGGAAAFTLELPPLPGPATGNLPGAAFAAAGAAPVLPPAPVPPAVRSTLNVPGGVPIRPGPALAPPPPPVLPGTPGYAPPPRVDGLAAQ